MASKIDREELHLQASIAKAVELRALHASLTNGTHTNPSILRNPPGASPCFSKISVEDYPVFTPVSSLSLSFFFYFPFVIGKW